LTTQIIAKEIHLTSIVNHRPLSVDHHDLLAVALNRLNSLRRTKLDPWAVSWVWDGVGWNSIAVDTVEDAVVSVEIVLRQRDTESVIGVCRSPVVRYVDVVSISWIVGSTTENHADGIFLLDRIALVVHWLPITVDLLDRLRGPKLTVGFNRRGSLFIDADEFAVNIFVDVVHTRDRKDVVGRSPCLEWYINWVLVIGIICCSLEDDFNSRLVAFFEIHGSGGNERDRSREGDDGRSEGLHYK